MNSKRLLSFLLVFVLAATAIFSGPVDTNAASTNSSKVSATSVWDGTADTSWYTGTADSYNIYTAEQLAGFAQLVNTAAHDDRFRGITINLMNDICLNETYSFKAWDKAAPKNHWDPIGEFGGPISGYRPFAGVFNGNGHTISGMYADNGEGGLFCYTSGAVIKDLRITKSVVIADKAGAFVGVSENSYFENCEAIDCKITSNGGRFAGAGGIIGNAEQINNVALVAYSMLFAVGIVVNPILWFNSDVDKKDSMYGTYITNSRVVNCTITSASTCYLYNSGGLIGGAIQPFVLYNNYVADCTLSAYQDFGLCWDGTAGGIVGTMDDFGTIHEHIIKKNYVINCKTGARTVSGLTDTDLFKKVTAKTLKTKAFANKLGSEFTYVKNSYPAIKSINYPVISLEINGNTTRINWDAVSGAKKYKIYIKQNGKYKLIDTVTTNSCKLKNVIKKNKNYDMLIKAVMKDGSTKVVGEKFRVKNYNI